MCCPGKEFGGTMTEDMSFGGNAIFSQTAIQQVVASEALLDQADAVAQVLAIRDGTVTAGTRVSTLRGALRAHDLRPGDKVLTRDNGY